MGRGESQQRDASTGLLFGPRRTRPTDPVKLFLRDAEFNNYDGYDLQRLAELAPKLPANEQVQRTLAWATLEALQDPQALEEIRGQNLAKHEQLIHCFDEDNQRVADILDKSHRSALTEGRAWAWSMAEGLAEKMVKGQDFDAERMRAKIQAQIAEHYAPEFERGLSALCPYGLSPAAARETLARLGDLPSRRELETAIARVKDPALTRDELGSVGDWLDAQEQLARILGRAQDNGPSASTARPYPRDTYFDQAGASRDVLDANWREMLRQKSLHAHIFGAGGGSAAAAPALDITPVTADQADDHPSWAALHYSQAVGIGTEQAQKRVRDISHFSQSFAEVAAKLHPEAHSHLVGERSMRFETQRVADSVFGAQGLRDDLPF